MAEISLNSEILEEKIQKLKNLKTTCEEINVAPEETKGSGKSIAVLTLIDKEYPAVKAAMLELLTNSISFYENVKKSMVEADQKAAEQMKKGGQ